MSFLILEFSTTAIWEFVFFFTAFVITFCLIPPFSRLAIYYNIYGMDLNKPFNRNKIPEALGIVPSTVFISFLFLYKHFISYSNRYNTELNCLLFYIIFTTIIGIYDDLKDLRWRYKIILPTLAALPIIAAYKIGGGSTDVAVPRILQKFIGGANLIPLGPLYYVYMVMLIVFCTNSINIYAGVNGLEVGQSMVISLALAVFNLYRMIFAEQKFDFENGLFSIGVMGLFFAVSFALFLFNKYPSKVFVGDTYTLFAGSVISITAIFGHFGKTVIFFFIPQIFNFVYSLPQLFRIFGYKCPKHRIPIYDKKLKKLKSSKNLTLLNLTLEIFGPMTEKNLSRFLIALQIFCSVVVLLIIALIDKY